MQTLASNMGGNEMNKLKENFGFDFWQKFGKALMVVIAVMPAAGLMISIGKTIAMINPNAAPLVITGGFLEQIGWGIIGNLHILFALAIGGSWAKERAGGAFAAGFAFILINRLTGSIFGDTSDILAASSLEYPCFSKATLQILSNSFFITNFIIVLPD